MFDFLENYFPTAIQYALVIYTINTIMSFKNMDELYENIAWYSIKCSAALEQSSKSFNKLLKYSGIISNKHRIDFITNGEIKKTVVLYRNTISENTIMALKHSTNNINSDLIMYTAPVNDNTNKNDIIIANSLDNIKYPYISAKNQMYSLAISWPSADDNASADGVIKYKNIDIDIPYNFCIEGNRLFTKPFMMWLFNYYGVSQDSKYIKDYKITFFDNMMTPHVITRKNHILIENNVFNIERNEKNDSDTDDSNDSNDQTSVSETNNWYNFFY